MSVPIPGLVNLSGAKIPGDTGGNSAGTEAPHAPPVALSGPVPLDEVEHVLDVAGSIRPRRIKVFAIGYQQLKVATVDVST